MRRENAASWVTLLASDGNSAKSAIDDIRSIGEPDAAQ
jgi:hypothetical protein